MPIGVYEIVRNPIGFVIRDAGVIHAANILNAYTWDIAGVGLRPASCKPKACIRGGLESVGGNIVEVVAVDQPITNDVIYDNSIDSVGVFNRIGSEREVLADHALQMGGADGIVER
jgi:hypothetical protein